MFYKLLSWFKIFVNFLNVGEIMVGCNLGCSLFTTTPPIYSSYLLPIYSPYLLSLSTPYLLYLSTLPIYSLSTLPIYSTYLLYLYTPYLLYLYTPYLLPIYTPFLFPIYAYYYCYSDIGYIIRYSYHFNSSYRVFYIK